MNLEQARFFMVEQQIRPWDVLDPQVLELLETLPRHEFVAESQQALAYTDIELPIGEGQFMLAPKIEARLLQALDVGADDKVLEVGTGSGFLTAMLASLAKHVTSIEIFESLQQAAQTRLSQFDNIELTVGDASQGWPSAQPYDVIALTGSIGELGDEIKHQLTIGGRLFAFVGDAPAMQAQIITRISEQDWSQETIFETQVPPLINAQNTQRFTF